MRYGLILGILVGLIGCGEVMEATTPDAGDGSTAGTGGTASMGGAGGGGAGGSAAGADGATTCTENTRQDCRDRGDVVVTAQYACHDDGYNETLWGACTNGHISDAYYSGLPCPFDVGITTTAGWTGPAPGAVDGTIITNGGGSTSTAWRNTDDTIYCCDSNTVRKIARCK